jgi:hypothetical protein
MKAINRGKQAINVIKNENIRLARLNKRGKKQILR